MAIVSLIDGVVPAGADGWHRVHAPGGYESWNFGAQDKGGRYRIFVAIMDGAIGHPGYLRRYEEFLRRPTQCAPPVPRDYPGIYFWIYDAQGDGANGVMQFAAGDFLGAENGLDVRVGPHWARRVEEAIDLHVEKRAELRFRPRVSFAGVESVFLSRQISGGEHRWVVGEPLCDVSGVIHVGDQAIEIAGAGYHDHLYGSAPIGPGLKRWMRGWVTGADHAVGFHLATPEDFILGEEAHLVSADAGSITMAAVKNLSAGWDRRSRWGLAYPSRVDLDDVLHLSRSRVRVSSPVCLKMEYEAIFNGKAGRAFCELAYPGRLGWPVLGKMMDQW